jgi:hypothetical protein
MEKGEADERGIEISRETRTLVAGAKVTDSRSVVGGFCTGPICVFIFWGVKHPTTHLDSVVGQVESR